MPATVHGGRRSMSQQPVPAPRWRPALIPIAGSLVFAASCLVLYVRDLGLQEECATSLRFLCPGFQADPRVLGAAGGFASLALALALATVVGASPDRRRRGGRRWLAPALFAAVAASFAGLVTVLTMASVNSTAYAAAALAIWAFLGAGYVALWVAAAFPSALVGAWRSPARALAVLQGAIAIVATVLTAAQALGPGPGLL